MYGLVIITIGYCRFRLKWLKRCQRLESKVKASKQKHSPSAFPAYDSSSSTNSRISFDLTIIFETEVLPVSRFLILYHDTVLKLEYKFRVSKSGIQLSLSPSAICFCMTSIFSPFLLLISFPCAICSTKLLRLSVC